MLMENSILRNISNSNIIFKLTKTLKNVKFYSKISKTQLQTIDMATVTYTNPSSTGDVALPLIIMHGLFGSKRNWNSLSKALIVKLAPQREVIAADARNHGESPHTDEMSYPHLAEDINVLMKKLKLEKTVLLGHSMGGRAVMYFAINYPELVERLIVADISPVNNSSEFSSLPAVFAAVDQVKLPISATPIRAARKDCDRQLAPYIKNKDQRAFLITNLAKGPSGNYVWSVNVKAIIKNFPEHLKYFPDLKERTFDNPVLFIAGGKSDHIRKGDFPKILEIFPKAEFVEIKEAGHWVHIDQPVQFLKVCAEFLNKNFNH